MFFAKSQCQSPFPLSLESWHLLKVDRVFISFMFKSVNWSILQKTYCCIWSVTLAKSIVPRKTWPKLWHSYISKLFLTKMQVKFSILLHHGSLNVIGDQFRFVRSKLKSRAHEQWNITFIRLKTRRQEPTERRASVLEFITRQTCKICDYTVDYRSVTLAKSIVPRKTWRKLWHSYISKLFLTKMQVKFSILFHHGSLNVIGDKFWFN
jgi:hypothetical protein